MYEDGTDAFEQYNAKAVGNEKKRAEVKLEL
jgi:hypothetical protein